MQETQVWSLGQEDPLEKEMTAHSSIVARRISRTGEPGRLQSIGLRRVGRVWVTDTFASLLVRATVKSNLLTLFTQQLFNTLREAFAHAKGGWVHETPVLKHLLLHRQTLLGTCHGPHSSFLRLLEDCSASWVLEANVWDGSATCQLCNLGQVPYSLCACSLTCELGVMYFYTMESEDLRATTCKVLLSLAFVRA